MTGPSNYFSRVAGRVNVPLLQSKLVVIVGVGTVGSKMAQELAKSGVRRLRLIDGDSLEDVNLSRHVLPPQYVGMNKAEALTVHLAEEVPELLPEAVPRYVDVSLSDGQLDKLLEDADLIVATTDDRGAQRRIGRRALALDIPAVFPALYTNDGGEVFVQRSPRLPCFLCWDAHRPTDQRLRAVTALNADTLALVQLAVHLSLGILDRNSEYARLLATSPPHPNPPQLFVQNRFALGTPPVSRRPNCPSCAVGPATGHPPPRQPPARPQPVASAPQTQVSSRGVLAALGAAAAVITLIVILSGGSSAPPPSVSATQARVSAQADALARKQAAARKKEATVNQRLAQLSFRCIERGTCQTVQQGQSLPLFIAGMDANLVSYLSAHHYRDVWRDTWHSTSGQAIGTNETPDLDPSKFTYVTQERDVNRWPLDTGDIGTGLTATANLGWSAGLTPSKGDTAGPWKITWQLKDASGAVVKELRYTVNVIVCDYSNYTLACFRNGQATKENWYHSLAESSSYPPDFYRPPPPFPYTS